MPRLLPFACLALPLAAAACNVNRAADQKQLAQYQHNAMLYWEGGKLDQAMQLVERGLEIDPDDYKLNALRGTIMLRRSSTIAGTDHKALDEATESLAEVYDSRAVDRHEPYLLFYYALALEK